MFRFITYLLLFTFTTGLWAQDQSEYMMVMVRQKKALKMARTELDFQTLADNFERIANSESDQWHPLYYAGLCYINVSLVRKVSEQKDAPLDKAQTFIDRALEIYPDESELYVLQALLDQARIQVDESSRSNDYLLKAKEALEVAKDFDPDNPRIYYLMALTIMHTPEEKGGGVENACEYFGLAVEKFNLFRPDHVLSPTWGGEPNYQLFNQYCNDRD